MRRHDEEGSQAVELALILPVLVLLLMGIIEFGRGYNARVTLTSAVREGARAYALGKDAATITDVTETAAAGLDKTNVTSGVDADADGIVDTAELGVFPACSVGQPAEVTANYPMTYSIPFFGEGTWTISATGAMRCGG